MVVGFIVGSDGTTCLVLHMPLLTAADVSTHTAAFVLDFLLRVYPSPKPSTDAQYFCQGIDIRTA